MQTTDDQSGVIVDPSALFTEEALEWLRDPAVVPWLVVSASLYELIRDGELDPVFEAYDVRPHPALIGQIYQALEAIRKFSYQEPPALPGETGSVLDAILSSDDPLRKVIADEWVFLTTQSFAVLAPRPAPHSESSSMRAPTSTRPLLSKHSDALRPCAASCRRRF